MFMTQFDKPLSKSDQLATQSYVNFGQKPMTTSATKQILLRADTNNVLNTFDWTTPHTNDPPALAGIIKSHFPDFDSRYVPAKMINISRRSVWFKWDVWRELQRKGALYLDYGWLFASKMAALNLSNKPDQLNEWADLVDDDGERAKCYATEPYWCTSHFADTNFSCSG